MNRKNFFIARHLDKVTLSTLRSVQKNIKENTENFTISQTPHLTYAGSKFVVKRAMDLQPEQLYDAVFPLPMTALERLTLPVKGIKSVQGRREKPYLVIDLDDSEQHYSREKYAIDQRVTRVLGMKALSASRLIPAHVTLGKAFTKDLSNEVIDRAESELPDSLTFKSISYPSYVVEAPDRLPFYSEQEMPKQVPRQKIPAAFLNTLKK